MRRRIVLSIAGVATAAVVLFALPLAVVLQRSYNDEALLRLQRDTVAATRQIDLGTGLRDQIELPRSADILSVYDLRGRRVAGAGPGSADSVTIAAIRSGRPAERRSAGELLVAVPLVVREQTTGVVRARRDDRAVSRRVSNAWLALGGLGALVVALAGVAAAVLARRLSRPLERLSAAATRLGEGDFATRAPRSGVTEVDAVASAMDSTARRLDDLVARERTFSADASHQLRTPLAALRIELEAMQLAGESPEQAAAALVQADRLQATVETLLAIARDMPRRDLEIDLAMRVDELESRWRGPLADAGRPLRILVPAGLPPADASPKVVDEILDVLVSNAYDHGAGAVTVSIRQVDEWLAIDVQDQGAGFTVDPAAAFERGVSDGSGHGIGLALARSLAHAEGGRLIVTRGKPEPVMTLMLRVATANAAS